MEVNYIHGQCYKGSLVALSFVGLLVLRFLAAAAAVPGRQVGGRGSSARRGSRGGGQKE